MLFRYIIYTYSVLIIVNLLAIWVKTVSCTYVHIQQTYITNLDHGTQCTRFLAAQGCVQSVKA